MNCTISYTPKFVDDPTAMFERLAEELPLKLHSITVRGEKIRQPRLVCWHGPGAYAYSGLTLEPESWLPDLIEIRDKLILELKTPFNSVLVNYYPDETSSVGWHADDETYFGDDPTIATISLGAPRLFCMRKRKGGGKPEKFVLENGSMFLMGAGVQQNWLHAVPKSQVPVGPRLSLTYRIWKDRT